MLHARPNFGGNHMHVSDNKISYPKTTKY